MASLTKDSEQEDIATTNTLTEQAASFLERDVLSGVLPPGTKLVIADLVERYGIGATPVREGLSRLVMQGFVQAIRQRGFRVADISEDDLRDVTNVRQLIEVEALRLSIAHGDDEWESNIVASLHKIQLFTRKGQEAFREGAADFDDIHRGFHTALLAACGSPRLLELHRNLYDQAYRYRRLMMARHEYRENFYEEHKALAEVILRRDSAFACKLLADHLQRTMSYVYPHRKYR